MRHGVKAGLGAGLVGALLACGNPQTASQTKHDLNKPVRDADSWNWRQTSRDEYAKYIAAPSGFDDKMLPVTDPLVVREQAWLDRIDAQLRALHPEQLANTPKPQAMVIDSKTANAFVASITVCYDLPVKFAGASGETLDKVGLDVRSGTAVSWQPEAGDACVDAGDAQATFAKVVETFNANSTNGCRLSLENGTLVLSEQCPISADLASAAGAKSIAIERTANFVTVFSGIVPMMDEDAFAAVLAHETGHYYRSHGTSPSKDYDYFYTLTADHVDHKPAPEAALKADGQAAYKGAAWLSINDNFTAVPAQKLDSSLYFALGSLTTAAGKAHGTTAACKKAEKVLDGRDFLKAMQTFPFVEKLSDDQTKTYAAFEEAVVSCLKTVDPAALSWDDFRSLVANPTWPSWLDQLPVSTQSQLARILRTVKDSVDATAPTGETMADVVLAASKDLAGQTPAAKAALQNAYAKHIGQYTIEEEADDEALEFVSDLGLDPEAGVKAMHALNVGSATGLGGLELGEQDCDALWNHHWLNGDGTYAFVPVGDYAEIHHSTCYRMFNMEREIKAHGEKPADGVKAPDFGGSAWTAIQDEATKLSQESAAGSHEHLKVTALKKSTGLLECTYATGL